MAEMRPESLFLVIALAHVLLAAYALLRISRSARLSQADKSAFRAMPAEPAVTPETLRLDQAPSALRGEPPEMEGDQPLPYACKCGTPFDAKLATPRG